MNILLEPIVFSRQIKGGVSRYTAELFGRLSNTCKVIAPLLFSRNTYLAKYKFTFPLRGKMAEKANKYLTRKAIRNGNYDLLHIPNMEDFFIDDIPLNKPCVLTIHDMVSDIYPSQFPAKVKTTTQKLIARADRIIAISEQTKNDIIKFYNYPSSNIDIIHHASPFSIEEVNNCNIKNTVGEYVLFVGYRAGYKNFENFCKAMQIVIANNPNLKIVLAGGRKLTTSEKQLIKKCQIIQNIIPYRNISDKRLISLYKHALLLVFPSKYEGFGLPILEAFTCQTPIAISNVSCFPEIAQDAAEYFNPDDINDMAIVISRVIKSDSLRNDLREKGRKRLKDFSWDKTISDTLNCYAKAILNK
jgi:glycosyltransferase involved in cell wall biosynthesis